MIPTTYPPSFVTGVQVKDGFARVVTVCWFRRDMVDAHENVDFDHNCSGPNINHNLTGGDTVRDSLEWQVESDFFGGCDSGPLEFQESPRTLMVAAPLCSRWSRELERSCTVVPKN